MFLSTIIALQCTVQTVQRTSDSGIVVSPLAIREAGKAFSLSIQKQNMV